MIKEMIISIIIVGLIIFGNIFTQNYTKKTVEEMNFNLEELKQATLDENKQSSDESFQKLSDYWEQRYDFLSYYIEHDELEKVGTEMKTIEVNIEIEEYNLATEKIDKCIFLLDHIQDKEAFNLPNIF